MVAAWSRMRAALQGRALAAFYCGVLAIVFAFFVSGYAADLWCCGFYNARYAVYERIRANSRSLADVCGEVRLDATAFNKDMEFQMALPLGVFPVKVVGDGDCRCRVVKLDGLDPALKRDGARIRPLYEDFAVLIDE